MSTNRAVPSHGFLLILYEVLRLVVYLADLILGDE